MNHTPKYWAILPAAGIGSRMQSTIPKQYLPLAGKTVIEHALQYFLQAAHIEKVVVVLAEHDRYWSKLSVAKHPKIMIAQGGELRAQSVLNALHLLKGWCAAEDWVVIHDAARPCVQTGDITTLIGTLHAHPVGGLLAMPVRDTLKRINVDRKVINTVEREDLWHALTPQMFRYQALMTNLADALNRGITITDEASAMELNQQYPQVVLGRTDNIKITFPEDLGLAEYYLKKE